MSRKLEYLSTPGEWVDRWSGPGGSLVVTCSQFRAEHGNICWLLGRFHHHGVFTPTAGGSVAFAGEEGADYPPKVVAALGPQPEALREAAKEPYVSGF